MKINTSDISVIVQGAVDKKLTPKCLRSIRKYLPSAEIILSTWEETDTNGLDYDKLVLNKDPGNTIIDEVHNTSNNVNRQIVSTKQGLFAATRKYALKLRSDMALTGTNFINEFCKYYDAPQTVDNKLFKHRIVINNFYCANPYRTRFLFHISDWCQFGQIDDLIDLWDIPMEPEQQQLYFKSHKKPQFDPIPSWLMRYIPEQYILTACVRKHKINPGIEWYADINPKSLEISEKIFANNIIILNYEKFGINFMKFDPYKWGRERQYSNKEWMELYKKYINPDFRIPKDYGAHLQKHFNRFIKPIRYFVKWCEEPLSLIYYVVLYLINKTRIFCGKCGCYKNSSN